MGVITSLRLEIGHLESPTQPWYLSMTIWLLYRFLHRFDEARSEVHDLEMTRTGLEGVLASLREEMGQLEAGLTLKSQDLEQAQTDAVRLNTR